MHFFWGMKTHAVLPRLSFVYIPPRNCSTHCVMEVSIFYLLVCTIQSQSVQWLAGTSSRYTVHYRSGGPLLVVSTVQKWLAGTSINGTVKKWQSSTRSQQVSTVEKLQAGTSSYGTEQKWQAGTSSPGTVQKWQAATSSQYSAELTGW